MNQRATIGIVIKHSSIPEQLSGLLHWLEQHHCAIRLDAREEEAWKTLKLSHRRFTPDDLHELSFIVVLGGDGTLIGAARMAAHSGTPLFAVNSGKLGFLTDTTLDCMYDSLAHILEGRYSIEERDRLQAEILRQGEVLDTYDALNDICISKSALARMLTLKTTVDDRYLTDYRADGLIVSSATGSTAYSLSAGGPILTPSMQAVIVAPICPHTLSARPIVLPLPTTIAITLTTNHGEVYISVDGQEGRDLYEGDTIKITLSEQRTKLMRATSQDFFSVLRQKLRWGEA